MFNIRIYILIAFTLYGLSAYSSDNSCYDFLNAPTKTLVTSQNLSVDFLLDDYLYREPKYLEHNIALEKLKLSLQDKNKALSVAELALPNDANIETALNRAKLIMYLDLKSPADILGTSRLLLQQNPDEPLAHLVRVMLSNDQTSVDTIKAYFNNDQKSEVLFGLLRQWQKSFNDVAEPNSLHEHILDHLLEYSPDHFEVLGDYRRALQTEMTLRPMIKVHDYRWMFVRKIDNHFRRIKTKVSTNELFLLNRIEFLSDSKDEDDIRKVKRDYLTLLDLDSESGLYWTAYSKYLFSITIGSYHYAPKEYTFSEGKKELLLEALFATEKALILNIEGPNLLFNLIRLQMEFSLERAASMVDTYVYDDPASLKALRLKEYIYYRMGNRTERLRVRQVIKALNRKFDTKDDMYADPYSALR